MGDADRIDGAIGSNRRSDVDSRTLRAAQLRGRAGDSRRRPRQLIAAVRQKIEGPLAMGGSAGRRLRYQGGIGYMVAEESLGVTFTSQAPATSFWSHGLPLMFSSITL